ncbi:CcdB family protein [Candidatus Phycosocius spiralis]|uniref:Toxin CcdB n=1 Tax=Candidatus Phycosocius spiralis TaxID=2815099 RepID=A0ABQ4PWK9_9PROT|nr:CcdB family protein [Candidatus Phycosocius spiralis]GIU67457.1 hypothetical protein PsB1_1611 [Candidatus Phycosocius spiralis]
MKRFEIWKLAAVDQIEQLVVVLQSERVDQIRSIIVAPLRPAQANLEIEKLMPQIAVLGKPYVVLTPLLSAVDRRELVEKIDHAGAFDYEIMAALDRLFTGL